MNPKRFKSYLLLIGFAMLLYLLKDNFSVVWEILGFILVVITPFVVGFCLAYILNMPYNFFAEKAFAGLAKRGRVLQKLRKPFALITAYLVVIGILAFLIVILIPQLVESVDKLIKNFSDYANSFQSIIVDFSNTYLNGIIDEKSDFFQIVNQVVRLVTGGELSTFIHDMASYLAPSIYSMTMNITTYLYNIGMGIVISFYFLACKDKLVFQTKKLTYAIVPEKYLPKVLRIGELSNRMCGRYIYGRVLDSLIIGILCFIGMSIFGFDYPLVISVIVGITNVIPVFGPFLGAIPSIFIMLIIDPFKGIWFTVFIIILQQIDGNFIGPKIMGTSIGISGFWIMASVIIGGGFFGIVGMFISVPIFSIIYVLVGDAVNKRISKTKYAEMFGSAPDTDIINTGEKKRYNVNDAGILKSFKEKRDKYMLHLKNKKEKDKNSKRK